MQTRELIHVVSCHAAGEVGDVIVGGVAPPPGATIREQARFIAADQTLRNFVLNEPRGGVFRHVNLLVPPQHPQAHMGWIVMEPEDTPLMSGSNSMCVTTVLLETGIIAMQEPETHLVLEPPGGLIEVTATCHDGKVQRVAVRNVPSFADKIGVSLEVPHVGTLTVDTAYGGDSFVIVDAHDLGFAVKADEAREIAEMGVRITAAANEQLGFNHPDNGWGHISFCQIAAPLAEKNGVLTAANAVAIRPAKLDRSPCGTGCSARMAVLHAKGRMKAGDRFIGTSIIGTQFDCHIDSEVRIAGRPGIRPVFSGSAWITGIHQHTLDPADPFPAGYRLSDTWPMRS